MNIKAVFLDFDYTLYSHKRKCIPQSAFDALIELHDRGVKIFLATGRNILEMSLFPEYKNIPFDGFVMLNGQLCLDGSMQTIYANPFKGEALDALVKLFDEMTMPVVFVEKDEIFINFQGDVVEIANGEIAALRHRPGVYRGNPLYLAVAYIDESQEAALLSRLPGCCLKRWSPMGVDIVPAGMDKTQGIRMFLDRFGIRREECMAIGDSFNDIGMINYAGTGVVMGNGVSEAKAAADYVTADIDSDGFALALEHYGLI